MVDEKQDTWDQYVQQACWAIRSSFNESTKRTPYEVMFLRKARFSAEFQDNCSGTDPCVLVEQTPADYTEEQLQRKGDDQRKLYTEVKHSIT